ncbi:Neuropilin-1 [Stylophora pistillata]|uniref:Neuropilin-1 n=1 Tax=Stylophora pistillata TaxID=50429 RepID=A0A2B4S7W5_STYPI|nr:Neuropilin-1 [Stylophora pistillata]
MGRIAMLATSRVCFTKLVYLHRVMAAASRVGNVQVFSGNSDRDTIVTHVLMQPIEARYVQINPRSWYGFISMRTEFYGCRLSDRYKVLGRTVDMNFVREHLTSQRSINFGDSQEWPNNIDLQVMADSIVVSGNIKLRGTKKLTMFSRKLAFVDPSSKLDIRAPVVTKSCNEEILGKDGCDGNHGADGPTVEIFADTAEGYINILTNGGNGRRGSDGDDGAGGPNDNHKQRDRTRSQDCEGDQYATRNSQGVITACTGRISGIRGRKGMPGYAGGYAGNAGNGGDAGHQTVNIRSLRGKMNLTTCRGVGGPVAANGEGGAALVMPGTNGEVEDSYLQKSELSRAQKDQYPLPLLKVITRYAADLVWANETANAEVAQQRLRFLNAEGFDRFGNNELFAPLIKWERFKTQLTALRDNARDYEVAYNGIQASIQQNNGLKQIAKTISMAARIQVDSQKSRLQLARTTAISEKNAYVQSVVVLHVSVSLLTPCFLVHPILSHLINHVAAITQLELNINASLTTLLNELPDGDEDTEFTKQDLLVVLQGLAGIAATIPVKDPLTAAATTFRVLRNFATQCNTGTLQQNRDKLLKWLTFGKNYAALKDSSELDFTRLDVEAVPEIMRANLEINKEGLIADLGCMVDEASAAFKLQMESFFISGAARIDLIAKVIDLENAIGGYNFDILNLEATSNELASLRGVGKETLKNHQGLAVGAAPGTGQLRGVLELSNALTAFDSILMQGQQCFSQFIHQTSTHKWSFNNTMHPLLFSDLHNGKARFDLSINDSCSNCYNIRLLEMYIELYGNEYQNENNLPGRVYLGLRHSTGSYFRDGNGTVKEFRQPLSLQYRTFEFNRFAITDTAQCTAAQLAGNGDSSFCLGEDDVRLVPMCCHYLSGDSCDDTLSGGNECQSPFGTYELIMPKDDQLTCSTESTQITNKNCKDFDRTIYTNMNIWVLNLLWTDQYPTAPDDSRCGHSALTKSAVRRPPKKLSLKKNSR